MKRIMEILKKNKKIKYIFFYIRLEMEIFVDFVKIILGKVFFSKPDGNKKKMPNTIQLPITNRCNLNCKTCNIREITGSDFELTDLNHALKDKLFSEVENVGINGGEPFIVNNIIKYVETILTLPAIKSISIITNGVLTDIILDKVEKIYKICKNKNVHLNLTTSLDGTKEIHDSIRGINGAFEKTFSTYKKIQSNQKKYCDRLGVIFTMSIFNVYYVKDFMAFCEVNEIKNISYQLAVPHKRLHNESKLKFSVLEDEHAKMLAQEFFYEMFLSTKENRYYFIYKYLKDDKKIRMSYCSYQNRDVTIDAHGNICYCATESKPIGHISESNLYSVFFDRMNLAYRHELVNKKCNSCIHYTGNNGFFKYNIEAYKELFNRSTWTLRF